MAISKISNQTVQEMENKSVVNLPDRPSRFDYSAETVKRAFIDPITGAEDSVVAEVNRIVDAINALTEGSGTTPDTLATNAQTIIAAVNELKEKITGSGTGYTELSVTGASDIIGALNALQTAVTGLGTSKANASDVYAKADTYTKTEINAALTSLESTVKSYADTGLAAKQNTLTFDDSPTAGSANPVKSGGIKAALDTKVDKTALETKLSEKIVLAMNDSTYVISLAYFDDGNTQHTLGEIDLPLESVVVSGSYDSTNKKVVLTLQNGNTVEFSVSDLVSGLQSTLTFDDSPTVLSNNPVTSGGIYTALSGKQDSLTFDSTPTSGSNNPVKSKGIYSALAAKQNTLTFDNTPTANSDNPVKSGGIKTALDKKVEKDSVVAKLSSLPAVTNDSPDFVLYNGTLYRKPELVQDIDDLTDTTWTFKSSGITEIPSIRREVLKTLRVSFTYGGSSYDYLSTPEDGGSLEFWKHNNNDGPDFEYVQGYGKTITITGGDDVENEAAIAWFYENTVYSDLQYIPVISEFGGSEVFTIYTSDWSALSNKSPYTHSATVTALNHTIGYGTTVELINNQPVLFANHGFAIADVSGQNITIYSIGAPSSTVLLEVDYSG